MNPTPLTRLYSREKRVREWFVDGVIFFVIAARVMRSSLAGTEGFIVHVQVYA
jgi:hypothetical protein